MRVIAEITENMSQGEIHQMLGAGDAAITESEYMEVIRRKTAVLMEGACRVGAMVAGAGESAESALSSYGLHLGMAFQMADDLLDFTADSRLLGKETGADLREGKVTLPVIHVLRHADKETRTAVEKMVRGKKFSVQDFERLVKSLEFFGGLSYTRKIAGEHVAQAKAALSAFPPSESRDVLSSLADYSLSRNL
jgi:octaprenyl-diphosphate synthase